MPKSYKPRRKFNPKRHFRRFNYGLAENDAADLLDKFVTLELKAESVLLFGKCTDQEIDDIMDFLQWGKIAVASRDWYKDNERYEAQKVLIRAAQSTQDVMTRGFDTSRYVCTSQEIDDIRAGMDIVGPLMRRSIKECPHRTEKEWLLMIKYSRGKDCYVDIGQIRADIERV